MSGTVYPRLARDRGLPLDPVAVTPFDVAGWTVFPDRNYVERRGETVRLERRIMHVLVCLSARPGDVVSRADLLDVVWGDVVVGEEVLTRAVSQLRRALGRRGVTVIETIRGGGYRLVSPVAAAGAGQTSSIPRRRRCIGATAAIAAAVAGTLVVLWSLRSPGPTESPSIGILDAVPQTSWPGRESHPDWSPDGRRIALASWSEDGDGIRITQLGAEAPLELTTGRDSHPAFSPDGSAIAFVSDRSGTLQVWSCGIEGSDLVQLTRLDGLEPHRAHWSPDGERLALSVTDQERTRARVLEVATGRMTEVPADMGHELVHGWSADGEWLLVEADAVTRWEVVRMRTDGSGREVLYVPEEGRHLTRLRVAGGAAWFTVANDATVWRLEMDGSDPVPVVPAEIAAGWQAWRPHDRGLVVVTAGDLRLGWYDPATSRTELADELPSRIIDLAVGPGGRPLIGVHLERIDEDLMLVDANL